ncbi:MAG: hypothetical protein MK312_01810, partial [Roseibacillus sp.]|nr:hypothetical protein [Roseibacillus sp.]
TLDLVQVKRAGGLMERVIYYRKTPLPTYHSRLRSTFAHLLGTLAPYTGESLPAPSTPGETPSGPKTSP